MICPTCHNDMIVVEQERIELDYCAGCSGAWFDSGELELILELTGVEGSSPLMADTLSLPEAKTTEKKRRCPICNRKMNKASIGREPAVLIDLCPEGHGLWFDGGEVHELIAQYVERSPAESDSQERILTFLGDALGGGDRPAQDS